MNVITDLLATPGFPWYVFFGILSLAWGASIGSFLNVCIFRIPRELSVVTPRSFCTSCKTQIKWYHNLPIISFFALGRKCAYCGEKIIPRYVIVEILTAVLFLLVWLKFNINPGARFAGLDAVTDWRIVPVYWLAVSGLILGTFVDFEHLIIPDRVTLGGIVAGLICSALVPSLHNRVEVVDSLLWSAVGAAAGWLILWLIATIGKLIFRQEAMGFGDVKLMGAIGAFLGWKAVLFTVMASSLFGSVAGISLVIMKKKEMQSRIPYGPYIALAAVLWMLWGPQWWRAYIDFMMPVEPY